MTDTYEGWTNRETWAVALHINNDQGWQGNVHDAIREAWTAGHFSADQPHRVGEIVREQVEQVLDVDDWFHQDDRNLCREIMAIRDDLGSLWRVNWDELGASFLADALRDDL